MFRHNFSKSDILYTRYAPQSFSLRSNDRGSRGSTRKNWVDRRRDLQGVEFKCATEIDPPYADFYVDNGLVQVSGYIGDAWNELKDIMNFS